MMHDLNLSSFSLGIAPPPSMTFGQRMTVAKIKAAVASYYHVEDIDAFTRCRETARPRQVAMYLSRRLTRNSLPEIGRRFNGRDHTTILHGVRQITKLRQIDSELDEDIAIITQRLTGQTVQGVVAA